MSERKLPMISGVRRSAVAVQHRMQVQLCALKFVCLHAEMDHLSRGASGGGVVKELAAVFFLSLYFAGLAFAAGLAESDLWGH